MIWATKDRDAWRRRFAIFPIGLRDETIWLEWYWAKPCGEYTAVVSGKDRPA